MPKSQSGVAGGKQEGEVAANQPSRPVQDKEELKVQEDKEEVAAAVPGEEAQQNDSAESGGHKLVGEDKDSGKEMAMVTPIGVKEPVVANTPFVRMLTGGWQSMIRGYKDKGLRPVFDSRSFNPYLALIEEETGEVMDEDGDVGRDDAVT